MAVPTSASPAGAPVVASGRGWTASGLQGPVAGPGACHYRTAADGLYLPDPACTPGATDASVTEADLDATVCRSGGYTSAVRPPVAMTDAYKRQAITAYADPVSTGQTELDHLVPLGLGGASDTRNLWPEPNQGRPSDFYPGHSFGANAKDGVEDRLHFAVCHHEVDLVAAQRAIAGDWTTALRQLGLTP